MQKEAKLSLQSPEFKLQDAINNMPEYSDIARSILPNASG